MESDNPALMSAISPSTNLHRLERPFYLFWNDEFTSRSNARKNHLWTSPEFPLVAPITPGNSFDSSYYGEESDGELETSDSDVSKDPLDVIGTSEDIGLSLEREFPNTSEIISSTPARNNAPPPQKRQRIQDYIVVSSSPEISDDSERRVGPAGTRTRIVDFAICFLKNDPGSQRSNHYHYSIHKFLQTQVTIVVEGKRVPPLAHTENQQLFILGLRKNLNLARKDIADKKALVFTIYTCASFIAIAFAGPYWSFTVCELNNPHLKWSRPIAAGTKIHDAVLDTNISSCRKKSR
ncbi:hypothetical protein RHS01_09919 [Rhizoctonia solani]|uniref:Uncharacterized protein n=1 Tax=Rhizoctonia solani TaxID=456999 RepID=A0A8H7I4D9_9AGAM|nr:hypothetical protein RHS01_09919 [Rhizoctonia solani]